MAPKFPPGGLIDGQVRQRANQVVPRCDWYVVEAERFDYVGSGELSRDDLAKVAAELGDAGVFVAVRQPKPIEQVLGERKLGTRRLRLASKMRRPDRPKLSWVARGARVAVLPGQGAVWVDGERLFTGGESVPLPWTDPRVELVVVRPRRVLAVMRKALGAKGPSHAGSIYEEDEGD